MGEFNASGNRQKLTFAEKSVVSTKNDLSLNEIQRNDVFSNYFRAQLPVDSGWTESSIPRPL